MERKLLQEILFDGLNAAKDFAKSQWELNTKVVDGSTNNKANNKDNNTQTAITQNTIDVKTNT